MSKIISLFYTCCRHKFWLSWWRFAGPAPGREGRSAPTGRARAPRRGWWGWSTRGPPRSQLRRGVQWCSYQGSGSHLPCTPRRWPRGRWRAVCTPCAPPTNQRRVSRPRDQLPANHGSPVVHAVPPRVRCPVPQPVRVEPEAGPILRHARGRDLVQHL